MTHTLPLPLPAAPGGDPKGRRAMRGTTSIILEQFSARIRLRTEKTSSWQKTRVWSASCGNSQGHSILELKGHLLRDLNRGRVLFRKPGPPHGKYEFWRNAGVV